jgi:CheY-like chemotaxis protein
MIRVLVVEDENLVAMEMSWILEEAGYSIWGRKSP